MMIPVTISDGIFKQYNRMVTDFLWNGKKPRIALRKLCASRDIGGPAPPISFEMNFCVGTDAWSLQHLRFFCLFSML